MRKMKNLIIERGVLILDTDVQMNRQEHKDSIPHAQKIK